MGFLRRAASPLACAAVALAFLLPFHTWHSDRGEYSRWSGFDLARGLSGPHRVFQFETRILTPAEFATPAEPRFQYVAVLLVVAVAAALIRGDRWRYLVTGSAAGLAAVTTMVATSRAIGHLPALLDPTPSAYGFAWGFWIAFGLLVAVFVANVAAAIHLAAAPAAGYRMSPA
jgi:hypothetical protein